jgi:hypothetical protein
MEVYDVGPDCAYGNEYDDDYIWIVEWYENGGYDGSGEAVALGKDGLLYFANLGHCSCYGPYEDGFSGGITVEEYLKTRNDVLGYNQDDLVSKKVLELLDARPSASVEAK